MPTSRRRSAVVDDARVRMLLRRIAGDLSDLDGEDPATLAHDGRGLRAVKYSFVTAIEAVIDVAQHLCASEQWGAPATNGDALRILARHDVLDDDLAERLVAAVGFRNVLVHEYTVVDDGRVIAALSELDDLHDFIAAIERPVAALVHDHAGAEAGFHAALLGAVVTEVAAKLRVFKQRMRGLVDDLGGVQVDHRRRGNDHGIGIGHRALHHRVGLRRLLQVHIQCGQAHPLGITLDNQHRDQHASQQWPSKKTQCLEHQVSPDRLQGAGERP